MIFSVNKRAVIRKRCFKKCTVLSSRKRFWVGEVQGVPVLVCQTKLGDRDHRSKKILSKDPCPEMNRLASRRM